MISVIIPMYNAQNTIIQAIESVRTQTYKGEIEVLVINDGATDRSRDIVEEYIIKNPDMKITLINQDNGGASKARNAGLRKAKGDYIAFLDADDEWLNHKIDTQLPYLENQFDFIVSNRNNEKVKFPYKLIDNTYALITLRKLLIRVVGATPTALFKRKILEKTGYLDESQKYSEDANYWMRISLHNRMAILQESLVTTGRGKPSIGHSGLSANVVEMEKGAQKNINEMYNIGAINLIEFVFFKLFAKFKYIIRLIKLKFREQYK